MPTRPGTLCDLRPYMFRKSQSAGVKTLAGPDRGEPHETKPQYSSSSSNVKSVAALKVDVALSSHAKSVPVLAAEVPFVQKSSDCPSCNNIRQKFWSTFNVAKQKLLVRLRNPGGQKILEIEMARTKRDQSAAKQSILELLGKQILNALVQKWGATKTENNMLVCKACSPGSGNDRLASFLEDGSNSLSELPVPMTPITPITPTSHSQSGNFSDDSDMSIQVHLAIGRMF